MDRQRSTQADASHKIKGAYDHLKEKETKFSIPDTNSTPGVMKIFLVSILIFTLFTGFGVFSPQNSGIFDNWGDNSQHNNLDGSSNSGISAILYSSPTCGCCHEYVDIMNDNGFDVFQKRTRDYVDIKNERNIPQDHRSCHTMIVNSYFVEGHIPVGVVMEMLNSNSEIDGIALAGMPPGSPGMSGEKSGTWDVYSIVNGEALSIFRSV